MFLKFKCLVHIHTGLHALSHRVWGEGEKKCFHDYCALNMHYNPTVFSLFCITVHKIHSLCSHLMATADGKISNRRRFCMSLYNIHNDPCTKACETVYQYCSCVAVDYECIFILTMNVNVNTKHLRLR